MADLSNLHLHPAPALYFLGRTDMRVYKPRLQPHLSWWNLYHVYAYSLYCIIHHVNKVLFYPILFYSKCYIYIHTSTYIYISCLTLGPFVLPDTCKHVSIVGPVNLWKFDNPDYPRGNYIYIYMFQMYICFVVCIIHRVVWWKMIGELTVFDHFKPIFP